MMRLRPIVRSVLCCLLCLTVCAAPVLAVDITASPYGDGFLYWSNGVDIVYSYEENQTGVLSDEVSVLNGYFPASFSQTQDSFGTYQYLILGKVLPTPESYYYYSASTASSFYVEFLFAAPLPYDFTRTTAGVLKGSIGFGKNEHNTTYLGKAVNAADISFVVDGNLTPLLPKSETSAYFVLPVDSYSVSRFWGYRFYFNPLNYDRVGLYIGDIVMKLSAYDNSAYDFGDLNYDKGIYDEITINTGILQEIDGKIEDIRISTSQMTKDISDIKDTVTDTSEQLQNPSSNIWQAAGETISNTIESLFVPSSEDIESVKQGFDQLAQDKLGGAYQTVDMVSGGVKSVSDKFKNPGSSPGVEFPGISVPLGGDVGTVTLAASQTVTVPEQITDVLYPVAGIIIPIVCTIWTVRLGLDMVNCFMSGMSYGEFLHRHTSEEDDEV